MKHQPLSTISYFSNFSDEELSRVYSQGDIILFDAYPNISKSLAQNMEELRTKIQETKRVVNDPNKIFAIWEGGASTHFYSEEEQKNWIEFMDQIVREENLAGYNVWGYQDTFPKDLPNIENEQPGYMDLFGLFDLNGKQKAAWDYFQFKTPSIAANPDPCILPKGQTLCPTTIEWKGDQNYPAAQLWGKDNEEDIERLIACTNSNQQSKKEISWIKKNHTYTFTLYPAASCQENERFTANQLGQVIVSSAYISATPCVDQSSQQVCTTNIEWKGDKKYKYSQVWIKDLSTGLEKLMACSQSSQAKQQTAPWIKKGNSYSFTLYPANDCTPEEKIMNITSQIKVIGQ
jgi:hypothetical protein